MFVTKNSERDIAAKELEEGEENVEIGLNGIGEDIIIGNVGFIVNVIHQRERFIKIIDGMHGVGKDTIYLIVGF